jgi:hypothetical protein
MCGYVYVWVCVCVGVCMCGCVYVWVCVCVGFVMCGCFGWRAILKVRSLFEHASYVSLYSLCFCIACFMYIYSFYAFVLFSKLRNFIVTFMYSYCYVCSVLYIPFSSCQLALIKYPEGFPCSFPQL